MFLCMWTNIFEIQHRSSRSSLFYWCSTQRIASHYSTVPGPVLVLYVVSGADPLLDSFDSASFRYKHTMSAIRQYKDRKMLHVYNPSTTSYVYIICYNKYCMKWNSQLFHYGYTYIFILCMQWMSGANSLFEFSSSMFVNLFHVVFSFSFLQPLVLVSLQLLLQLNDDLRPKQGRGDIIWDSIACNVVHLTNRSWRNKRGLRRQEFVRLNPLPKEIKYKTRKTYFASSTKYHRKWAWQKIRKRGILCLWRCRQRGQ